MVLNLHNHDEWFTSCKKFYYNTPELWNLISKDRYINTQKVLETIFNSITLWENPSILDIWSWTWHLSNFMSKFWKVEWIEINDSFIKYSENKYTWVVFNYWDFSNIWVLWKYDVITFLASVFSYNKSLNEIQLIIDSINKNLSWWWYVVIEILNVLKLLWNNSFSKEFSETYLNYDFCYNMSIDILNSTLVENIKISEFWKEISSSKSSYRLFLPAELSCFFIMNNFSFHWYEENNDHILLIYKKNEK